MQAYLEKFLLAFIPLFVAIDPIGLVAIFLGLSGQADNKRRQHEGMLGLITSLAVSIGFIFLGKVIFRALGITVSDFQVECLILLGIAVRDLWPGGLTGTRANRWIGAPGCRSSRAACSRRSLSSWIRSDSFTSLICS